MALSKHSLRQVRWITSRAAPPNPGATEGKPQELCPSQHLIFQCLTREPNTRYFCLHNTQIRYHM